MSDGGYVVVDLGPSPWFWALGAVLVLVLVALAVQVAVRLGRLRKQDDDPQVR